MNALLEEERVALDAKVGSKAMAYLRGNGFLKNNKSQITADLKRFGTLNELFGPELKKIHFENGYLEQFPQGKPSQINQKDLPKEG
jgi:hypothetical protein